MLFEARFCQTKKLQASFFSSDSTNSFKKTFVRFRFKNTCALFHRPLGKMLPDIA